MKSIYPDLLSVDHSADNDRGILAPTNEDIENINNYILEKMPGDSHRLLSNDIIVTDDQNMPDVVSVEYLNEVDVPGTSPHKLHLKLGSLISFIGNIIRGISRHVLEIEVIADGLRLVKVPRTSFEV